ncbi:MAG: Na(+)-translocating NADH-quinone reductase subunit A [Cyclobacteriaceae bacterium]
MSKTIKLKRGFDINLVGKPEKKISKTVHADTYALKPSDFPHLSRPKLVVKEGDKVKAGSPVMFAKESEDVKYVAPVSGEVVEIKRGAKRLVLEIIIKADKTVSFEEFKSYSVSELAGLSKEDAAVAMQQGGVWPNIIQRPFGVVANPADSPKAIFISAFDTNPLAADIAFQLNEKEKFFQVGLDILKKFTNGSVHLNLDSKGEVAQVFAQATGVELNKFSGAHPAGNVGVQIHHLDPINKGDIAWTVSPLGVAQIGQLFLDGKYDASKLIALTGSEVSEPSYVQAYAGAQLGSLIDGQVDGANLRYISGSPLIGENCGKEGYLGYYHNQVTVIKEGDYEEFLGWLMPSAKKLSFHKALGLLSFLNRNKEYEVDTNTHGEDRPFVVSGEFEKVLPMDILPTYLFKAILAEDYDDMEALGIFELIEEDVALCEFIDPSKNELQKILRTGLDLIRNS